MYEDDKPRYKPRIKCPLISVHTNKLGRLINEIEKVYHFNEPSNYEITRD